MAYNVEFSEPVYDRTCDQWTLSGFLKLEIAGQHYRTLAVKRWLSHEARYNQNWFNCAKATMRKELEERANREMRSALQYQTPQPVTFSIPNVRRVYPQLITENIVSIQPIRPMVSMSCKLINKVNWKEEGF